MTKFKITFSFLVIIITSSCRQVVTCRDVSEKYFSLIEGLKSKGDTLVFIESLDKLIEKDPRCAKAFQIRGYFKMTLGEFSSAKKDFINSIKFDTSSVYSFYCLSGLYNMDNKNDSAFMFIDKAIRMKLHGKYVINTNNYFNQHFDVDYGKLIFQRGIVNHETGRLSSALSDFLKAIYHDYDKGEAYSQVAIVFWDLKKIDSACYYLNLAKHNSYFEIDEAVVKACHQNSDVSN